MPHSADTLVREACPADAATLHRFILELARYEREPDAVAVTPEILGAQMASPDPPFEAWIAERGGEAVGFALAFRTYSTWTGRPGLWLEDFYVVPEARRQGVGDALFQRLADVCRERGYGRLELSALDWNELAQRFYRRRGGVALDEWTTWRLAGDALERAASPSR